MHLLLPVASSGPRRYALPFRDQNPETPTSATFRFSLAGSGFQYRSNQAIRLGIPVNDPWGPYRHFSLSSSPTEREWIAVTAKITDTPFKAAMKALHPGDVAEVIGPLGDLIYDPTRPTVMIAGGIGVTPFRGMIRYAVDTGARSAIRLLYSARTPEELAFRAELDAMAALHPDLAIRYSITRPTESDQPWEGPRGRIGAPEIREVAETLDRPNFLVVGLPEMVAETVNLLEGTMGVPDDRVNWEPFRGY